MAGNDNKANILMKCEIFRDLPKDALEAIALAAEYQVAPQHTMISREGDPAESLYIISSGRVRIFRRNGKGREIDLAIQGPGEVFGEMSLITGEPRSADVEALEEVHLLVVSKDHFDRILREFPDISKIFLKEMRHWLLRGEKFIELEAGKARNASRISWVDFILVIGVSVILAMIFNYSNPNGIPLFPDLPDRKSIAAISAATAREEVQRGEALILDAMPANFYQERHIWGAVNIPLALFDIVYVMTLADEDREKKIVVYGGTISRPYDLEVANKLLLLGYRNVRVLEGGLEAWEGKGYPVEEKATK